MKSIHLKAELEQEEGREQQQKEERTRQMGRVQNDRMPDCKNEHVADECFSFRGKATKTTNINIINHGLSIKHKKKKYTLTKSQHIFHIYLGWTFGFFLRISNRNN